MNVVLEFTAMLIRHVQIRLVVSCALATKDLLEMDLIAKVWVVNNHCLSKMNNFFLETLQQFLHVFDLTENLSNRKIRFSCHFVFQILTNALKHVAIQMHPV